MATTTFKKNTPVRFRTRTDRPLARGKVVGQHQTVKGPFVQIKDAAGRVLNVRPAYVTALA